MRTNEENNLKAIILSIPIIECLINRIYRKWIKPFPGSMEYWNQRYKSGGDSGSGSYNELATFKAEIVNHFVEEHNIETVIEYGCGDGNQLRLASYLCYVGFDVSEKALSLCTSIFSDDKTKIFKPMDKYEGETAQLTLSLDVIYHLVEDDVFKSYMERLFNSSEHFVIIYSSNTSDNRNNKLLHVKHRKFSEWVQIKQPHWNLMQHIPNRYPHNDHNQWSVSDFYIYEKVK